MTHGPTLGIKAEEGETWRACAARYAEPYGLTEEVLMIYDQLAPGDPEDSHAAWCACQEWDLLQWLPDEAPEP